MFAFLEAKHGITSAPTDADRQRKHRHNTRHVRDETPWKRNQQPGTLCDVTSARPLQGDLPKLRHDDDVRIRTEQQDEGLPKLETLVLVDPRVSRLRRKEGRRHSDPPNPSPKEVPVTENRRGSVPLFTPPKPQESPLLDLFHGELSYIYTSKFISIKPIIYLHDMS